MRSSRRVVLSHLPSPLASAKVSTTFLYHALASSTTAPLSTRVQKDDTELNAETVDKLCKDLQGATEKMRQEWLEKGRADSIDPIDRTYGEKVWVDFKKTNPWVMKTPTVESNIKERYHFECKIMSLTENLHILSFERNRDIKPSQLDAIRDSLNDLGIKTHFNSARKLTLLDSLPRINQTLEESIERRKEQDQTLYSSPRLS